MIPKIGVKGSNHRLAKEMIMKEARNRGMMQGTTTDLQGRQI